jgi:hypothetical protein
MSEYVKVGRDVPYGAVEVGLGSVGPLRDIAARELLDAARAPKIECGDEREAIRYAMFFKAFDQFEADAQERFVSVSLVEDRILPSWRLLVNIRTFAAAQRHTSKRSTYTFETMEDEVLEAKKAIYYIRGIGHIVMDADGNPVEEVVTARKMFERPCHGDDCGNLLDTLESSAKRARVLWSANR